MMMDNQDIICAVDNISIIESMLLNIKMIRRRKEK